MRCFLCSLLLPTLLALEGCVPATRHTPTPSGPSQVALPGKQADGSVLLPNQWSLRPTGKQIELRDFPVNVAVHPRGRFVAVLHSGYSAHLVSIVDLQLGNSVSHATLGQSASARARDAHDDHPY